MVSQGNLFGPTLTEARQEFLAELREKHIALCPCCGTNRRINRYSISDTLARALLWMFRHFYRYPDDRFVCWRTENHKGNLPSDLAKLERWQLIEPTGEAHPRWPSRGHWRLTERGVKFVTGQIRLPKYVFDYYKILTLEGPEIMIWDCLSDRFDYHKLLSRAGSTEAEDVVMDSIKRARDS